MRLLGLLFEPLEWLLLCSSCTHMLRGCLRGSYTASWNGASCGAHLLRARLTQARAERAPQALAPPPPPPALPPPAAAAAALACCGRGEEGGRGSGPILSELLCDHIGIPVYHSILNRSRSSMDGMTLAVISSFLSHMG